MWLACNFMGVVLHNVGPHAMYRRGWSAWFSALGTCACACSGLVAPGPGQRAMGSAAHGHELTAKEMYIAHTASRHPFHVLPPSPWPIMASGGTMVTMLGEPLTQRAAGVSTRT